MVHKRRGSRKLNPKIRRRVKPRTGKRKVKPKLRHQLLKLIGM